MRLILTTVLLLSITSNAHAFEIVNQQKSYENVRLFSLGLGLGTTQFVNANGVNSGAPGFSMQATLGHRFNQYLEAQFVYNLSTIRFDSPDPIDPSVNVNTREGLNQELLKLKIFYPKVVAQPYISVGFGGYQFFGVDSETAMTASSYMEVPIGVGFQTFIYKNSISLDFDFTYHWMFGENQNGTTLNFLNLSSVEFDMFSMVGGFSFHFL